MTVVGKCVHRCTHVLDLEKTLAFYEKALGITAVSYTHLLVAQGGTGEELITATIDTSLREEALSRMPVFSHRRTDIY